MVRRSWNSVPRVPRMLVSAISEMYMGATTQKLPVEIPTKKMKMNNFKDTFIAITYQLRSDPNKASQLIGQSQVRSRLK